MQYRSRSYRFDDEVIAALEALVEEYGSANKGLRVKLLSRGLVAGKYHKVPHEEPVSEAPRTVGVVKGWRDEPEVRVRQEVSPLRTGYIPKPSERGK